jgi:ADP-ribose pyrophosphatase
MDLLLAPRIVHSGPVFTVERREYSAGTPGAAPIVRDVVRHPGAVAVVPITAEGRLILIRNFRVAVDEWLWELCAGKLERGEDPAAASARELEEETGFTAATITPLGRFFTSPGFADEVMHLFEARELSPVPRRLEPGERIEVEALPLERVLEMVRCGEIRDGKTIAGLFLWLRREGR